MQTETPDRILRLQTVLGRTGLSRLTIYRRMEKGTFPKNFQIGERMGWCKTLLLALGCATHCSMTSSIRPLGECYCQMAII